MLSNCSAHTRSHTLTHTKHILERWESGRVNDWGEWARHQTLRLWHTLRLYPCLWWMLLVDVWHAIATAMNCVARRQCPNTSASKQRRMELTFRSAYFDIRLSYAVGAGMLLVVWACFLFLENRNKFRWDYIYELWVELLKSASARNTFRWTINKFLWIHGGVYGCGRA